MYLLGESTWRYDCVAVSLKYVNICHIIHQVLATKTTIISTEVLRASKQIDNLKKLQINKRCKALSVAKRFPRLGPEGRQEDYAER